MMNVVAEMREWMSSMAKENVELRKSLAEAQSVATVKANEAAATTGLIDDIR